MLWVVSLVLTLTNFFAPILPAQSGSPAASAKHTATQLHYGDILHLYVYGEKDLTGDYQVQDDGMLYVPDTEGVEVLNLTVHEAQNKVKKALASKFKNPLVSLSLKLQSDQQIYVVGGTRPKGTVRLTPTTDLRKVVAEAGNEKESDLVEISVFRQGALIQKLSQQTLFDDQNAWNGPLEANDVIVIQPTPLRVWVSGQVRNPGRVGLPASADVYQAIAAAGDILSDGTSVRDDMQITIRRGTEEIVAAANPARGTVAPKLEPGDTILVQPPFRKHIFVSGEVKTPNEYILPADATVFQAITKAGGLTADGSYGSVYVLHRGFFKAYHGDSSEEREILAKTKLDPEDSVYVAINKKNIYVLGQVRNPGRYGMEDGREYHLAEVLARVGGLSETGTLRRAVIVRYSKDGKATATKYNLDEFLKDGKVSANPLVESGDFVYFGTPRGISFADLANGLSAAFILDTIAQKL